jgi:hypothetical protein
MTRAPLAGSGAYVASACRAAGVRAAQRRSKAMRHPVGGDKGVRRRTAEGHGNRWREAFACSRISPDRVTTDYQGGESSAVRAQPAPTDQHLRCPLRIRVTVDPEN